MSLFFKAPAWYLERTGPQVVSIIKAGVGGHATTVTKNFKM